MGTSGWDDDTRGRGRSSRDARPREGERLPGRYSERDAYEYDRSDRSGGRMRSRDDGWSDTDRSRSYPGRGGSASLGGPGSSSGRNRRPARDDYDSYGDGGGRDMRSGRENGRPERERSEERSMRGQRPLQRGDAWESPQRRGPGASGSRSNSSGRGGLWDDDAEMRGRRPGRPGGSDPRARNMGGRANARDPRALRHGLVSEREAQKTPEIKGVGCGPAILIVLLMFVVGAGGGFAAFKLTAPKVSIDTAAPAGTAAPSNSTPATTPSVAPKTSPTATPKADASHIWVASNAPYGI